MTQVPTNGNDSLIGVQTSVVQAGIWTGGTNPGKTRLTDAKSSTSTSGHIVDIVQQDAVGNYPVGVIDLSRVTTHTAHDDESD